MTLPDSLKNALELVLAKTPKASLAKASTELSSRYRNPERDKTPFFMTSDIHRMAYLAVRLPATFAVVRRVLLECKSRLPHFSPLSLCDIGAGPGTASWAAIEVFSEITQVTLHEKDVSWLDLGRKLMENTSNSALNSAHWKATDLLHETSFSASDLVILSYVVGELPVAAMTKLIDSAWASATQVIAIIEPGTPHGFERIRMIRDQLINKGAFLVAPCPHHKACPMEKGDWCHFAERVERSSLWGG